MSPSSSSFSAPISGVKPISRQRRRSESGRGLNDTPTGSQSDRGTLAAMLAGGGRDDVDSPDDEGVVVACHWRSFALNGDQPLLEMIVDIAAQLQDDTSLLIASGVKRSGNSDAGTTRQRGRVLIGRRSALDQRPQPLSCMVTMGFAPRIGAFEPKSSKSA